MPKKIDLKTKATTQSVQQFLSKIEDKEKRHDAKTLCALMEKITGHPPKLWGTSIVGFDSYAYTRSNGDTGEYLATGFSPRKNALTIYIMPGYQDYSSYLHKLGPHKIGKSCLYIKTLADVNMETLESLIKRGYQDLKKAKD